MVNNRGSNHITSVSAGVIFLLILTIAIWSVSKNKPHLPEDELFDIEEGNPDKYAEYHRLIRQPINGGNEYPIGYQIIEFNKALSQAKTSKPLNWVERGPGNVGGRTRALIVDPDDPTLETIWAGSVSGGLWKTTDGGRSWKPQTDHFPSLNVSSLAMAESNHDVMYLGTGGSAWGEDFSSFGYGIFRTSDRGVRWEHLQSTFGNKNFQDVYRLLVDPSDPNVVIAGTNRGLFRTQDGGSTWTRVCCGWRAEIVSLLSQPDNFNMQIAASGRFHNHSYYSVDGGLNWTRVHDPFGHSVHRAELAFSPSNPQIAYAAVYQDRISNLYKSYDAGKSWILTIDRSSEPVNWMRQQGYYNNSLAVHPFDPNIVFVGGVTMNRIIVTDSHNGSPTRIIDWGVNVDQAAHVDHHVIQPFVVDSLNEKFWIFNANDGGVAISENKGRYFDELDRNNSGYNTSQFYGIAKKPGESIYIGGTQDNGTSLSQHDPESDSYWEHVIGGDGFDAVWHKTNSDLVLGTTQYSGINKSTDGGHSFSPVMSRDTENGQFFTNLASSDLSPNEVYTTKSDGVYYSRDFGDTWYHTPLNLGCGRYTKIEVSKANPSIIWILCGSETGLGYKSKDRGNSYSHIPKPKKFKLSYVESGLATHPHEPATAYALFSAPNHPKIIETRDYGETWTDLSGFGNNRESNNGFPDVAVYDMIVMPHAPSTLWVGTEIGLFRSTDRGQSWHYVDDGLPPVAIWQMKIRDNEIILGTHGRGVWTINTNQIETFTFTAPIETLDLSLGVSFKIQLPELIGGQKPLTYTISPELPEGLSFDPSTRTLSGKPTTSTRHSEYIYTVRDSNLNTISLYFNITIGTSARAIHESLIALYTSTNGDQWTDNSGWDKNQIPQNMDDFNQWYGIYTIDGEISIRMTNNNLVGEIPPKLGNLSNLETLRLNHNQLTGEIPAELGNLSNLETLSLAYNQLTGEIPAELGNLSNLKTLSLGNNQLTGEIPAELGSLSQFWQLSLYDNQLTGEIPAELGNLSKLENLWLDGNHLTGEIPAELGNLSNLETLSLAYNQLTGEIPAELGNLSNLKTLSLGNNQLTGEIPAELGSLSQFWQLSLYDNQLTGEIPAELGNLSKLENLWLYGNHLTGEIPAELGNLSKLEKLYLNSNQLTGEFPPDLGNLSNLETLRLGNNQLTGEIPPELGNLSNLETLRLQTNQLTGEIPAELGNLSNLDDLWLFVNQLTGEIPPELANLSNLENLSLHANQLTGKIPPELGSLDSLEHLSLGNNQLTGEIPPELGNLSNLRNLWISSNQLTGVLPQSFLQLKNIKNLHFDSNLGLCSPPSPEFQNWLNSILYVSGNTCTVSFSSEIAPQSYPRALPIAPLVLPALDSGAPPIQYFLNSSDLPSGLRFDVTNRTIDGTPTHVTPPVQMIYRATDTNGSYDSLMFTIEIVSPVSSQVFESLPTEFVVHSNYPNPFNRSTKLRVDLPWTARVEVEVFDLAGRRVYSHSPLDLSAGWNREIHLTEMTLSAGVYVYSLKAISTAGVSVYTGRFVRSQFPNL